ncbi:MAG: hypothetical protein ACRDPY_42890 [Streptosporangiaceae bacterium]
MVRISDVDNVWLFSVRTDYDPEDRHRVCIYADDVEAASRIDVLIDAGDQVSELTAVPGYELAPIRGVSAGGLEVADELELILNGYDRPFSRLAAAVKRILAARDLLAPERAPIVNRFRASTVGSGCAGSADQRARQAGGGSPRF